MIENLGVQSLLRGRFSAWDLIVSDAGTAPDPWRSGFWSPFKTIATAAATLSTLTRVILMMNDKQNRWAREKTFDAMLDSWPSRALREGGERSSALDQYLSQNVFVP